MDRDTPLDTDQALLDLAGELIGPAIRRQCWLFPLDHGDRASIGVIAVDDIPVDPDPEDIGRFAEVLTGVVEQTGAASIVVLWERPGGPELRMQEADWAAGLAATGVPLRAQLLVHDDGVRLIDPVFEALVA